MKKNCSIFLMFSVLFWGCKPLENSIALASTNPPVLREDITFNYSADQIRYGENNIKKGWAKRNNVQVLQVKIINNSDQNKQGIRFMV